jgi:hypothetical protein
LFWNVRVWKIKEFGFGINSEGNKQDSKLIADFEKPDGVVFIKIPEQKTVLFIVRALQEKRIFYDQESEEPD